MTESRYTWPPIRTWLYLILSIAISAFVTLLGFMLFWTLFLYKAPNLHWLDSFAIGDLKAVLGFTLISTFVMSIPGFLFGIPTYMLLKAENEIHLSYYVALGAAISTFSGFVIVQFTIFKLFGAPFGLYVMFFFGGLVAGFLFHRLDRGQWV